MSSAPTADTPAVLLPDTAVPPVPHPLLVSLNIAVPFEHVGSGESPHGYLRCVFPLAAYSHSASDGRRPPAQAQ